MDETKRSGADSSRKNEPRREGASCGQGACIAKERRRGHAEHPVHGHDAALHHDQAEGLHHGQAVAESHGDHAATQAHHHHTHAAESQHVGGHHLLQVEHLNVSFRMYDSQDERFFRAKKRDVRVIRDLSVSVHAGEVVAVVGASGSGKTLLADSVLGLFEPNATVAGTVWFDGKRCDAADLRRLRGNGISLVPQSSANLDPLMKVGAQVRGVAKDAADARRRAQAQRELFLRYGLGPETADLYPFELSGGMVRRVLLCCALVDEPKLIVADEPTPGLDLDLAVRALDDLRSFADDGGGVLLITHDIELALRVADRVAVFKDGTVVEETAVANFSSPDLLRHPFTKALWHALPEHGFEVVGESDAAADAGEGAAAVDARVASSADIDATPAAGIGAGEGASGAGDASVAAAGADKGSSAGVERGVSC